MIKAIIFDLDGVIIDSEPLHEKIWKSFFEKQHIKITQGDLVKMKGVRAYDVIKSLMPDKKESEIADLKKERAKNYREHLEKDSFMEVKGVTKFIHELKRRGIAIAVATSAVNEIATFVLNKLRLESSIDALITAEDVKKGKPDPEIYLTAADKLKVNPKECLVFEDAPAGIKAAQVAHMKTIALLTSHKKEDFENVELFFNNFDEIDLDKIL